MGQIERPVYKVTVRREAKLRWTVSIPLLDGQIKARSLRQVDQVARAWIAAQLDVPVDEIKIQVASHLTAGVPDVDERLRAIREIRKSAVELDRQSRVEAQRLIRDLIEDGVAIMDVATMFGVSFQRIYQLIND